MTNIEEMKYWLINNEEELPKQGLAPRYDLMPTNPKAFGLTDCKIASESIIDANFFWAFSGPSISNGRFPPFNWKNYSGPSAPHFGQIDRYDFKWVRVFINIEK